jgi:triphosphoribosyl-dephospho-CoA synthase
MTTASAESPAPPVGLCAQLACIWETTARCPGNVHRFRDFPDLNYLDILASAAAVAPMLETAWQRPVGQTVLEGIRATRHVTHANPNLGVLLLLAPLAAVPRAEDLRTGLAGVLDQLDVADARAVYEAIRLANPAGLGRVAEQDIAEEPTRSLLEVMALAADRDVVARQYANGFHEVFEEGIPQLKLGLIHLDTLEDAIIFTHLALMALHPDSLIARKRGPDEAKESMSRALDVFVEMDRGKSAELERKLAELDSWLRAAGRGRNPGTTSDLVTACLFVALRTGMITLPPSPPWVFPGLPL